MLGFHGLDVSGGADVHLEFALLDLTRQVVQFRPLDRFLPRPSTRFEHFVHFLEGFSCKESRVVRVRVLVLTG